MLSTGRLIVSDNSTPINIASDVVITDSWPQSFMWGKLPHGAFYLVTHCGISTHAVVRRENHAWGENKQKVSTKWEDNFGLNFYLSICVKNAALHYGMKDCSKLKCESKNRKLLKNKFLPIFFWQELAGALLFCSVLSTHCLLIRAEKIASKQKMWLHYLSRCTSSMDLIHGHGGWWMEANNDMQFSHVLEMMDEWWN